MQTIKQSPSEQQIYRVGNLDCAHCAQEVEDAVIKLDGVNGVRVDFVTGKLHLDGDVPFAELKKRVEAIGKTIAPLDDAPAAAAPPRSSGAFLGFWYYLRARHETRLALIGGGLILVTLLLSGLGIGQALADGLFVVAMAIAAYPIARSGINNLRVNHDFNINLLMTIAAVGAVFIGETLEAATVIFLFAIGEALEGYTADRARDSLRGLMELAPAEAIRLKGGKEETVPVTELLVDDTILIKPGERIPMDGVVTAGASGVNQAPITGESMPVHKTDGSEVFAGSINGDGALDVRVTRLAADNTLNRIIRLVEEAQSVRAPSQRFIDRFAHYYTPSVTVVALLVALVPPLFFNAPFYDTPAGHGWLYRALALLVIACPCALVISTPVTVISAITAAARRGVLIKGGAHLEALGGIRAVAFDKTGTLTLGKPVVTQTRAVECAIGESWCADCEDVLALAAAVERRSTHPLAQAVVQAAEDRHCADKYPPAESVKLLGGQGIVGHINGQQITVGSHAMFDMQHPHEQALCDLIDTAEAQGQTTMLLHDGERVRGFIAVADEARSDSHAVIADLNRLGLTTVMLTGDNAAVAQAIGSAVGVQDVRAGLLPEAKVDAVRGLLQQYTSVAMVGDGVNDTPALATATVGVAMGGAGTAQALETADIALMADDLQQLPYAVRLSRFARSLIQQNIGLSLGVKLAFMVLALFGLASIWVAVFADMGISLLVTLNGMRPLKQR